MAIILKGKKFACISCLRGHCSSRCQHRDRPLKEIPRRGRPVSQCNGCQALRKQKKMHIKCVCLLKGKENESATTNYENENQGMTEEKVKEPEPLPLPRHQTARGKRLREDEDAITDADQPVRKSPCRSHNVEPVLGKRSREKDDAEEPDRKSICRSHAVEPVLGKRERSYDETENNKESRPRKRPHASELLELPDSVEPVLGKRERENDENDEGLSLKRQHVLEQPDINKPVLGVHTPDNDVYDKEGKSPSSQHASEPVLGEHRSNDVDESSKHAARLSDIVSIYENKTGAEDEFPVLTFMTTDDHTGTEQQNDLYNTTWKQYMDELIASDCPDVWTATHDLSNVLCERNDPFWGYDSPGDVIQTEQQNDSDGPSAQLYIP